MTTRRTLSAARHSRLSYARAPVMRASVLFVAGAIGVALPACDEGPSPAATSTNEAKPVETQAAPPAPTPVVEVQAPQIIVDPKAAAIGKDNVPVPDPALADRVFALLSGKPAIEGRTVPFVAMRNAKPSYVAAVAEGIFRAKASGVLVKSEARDNTTQGVALSAPATVADCTAVAWIAKNGSIAVWPAGGGAVKRVGRGLAGPDLTLGLAAVRERREGCGAPELVLGAEDEMPWGLVFDLAESALSVASAQANSVVLVTHAVPGKKLELR